MRILIRYWLLATSVFFVLWSTAQVLDTDQLLDNVFKGKYEVYFEFKAYDKAEIIALTRLISIDNVTQDLLVKAYADREGFARFLETGRSYQILPHHGESNRLIKMLDNINTRNSTDWDSYPTYETYVDMMLQFATEYPDLCQVTSIGLTNEGRDILVANITDNVGFNENEPEFFYSSSMHGDELTGYVLMLRLIDYLLSSYGSNPKVTNIVDGIDIYICPLANPDGTYAGGNQTVSGATRFNAFGVDLNRNYPDPDAGPHPDGKSWQTETIAFMQFAEQRNFVAGANIHGGAEVCNYPWDTWQHFAADNNWWFYVCREYADTVHAYSPSGYLTDLNNGITNGYAWYWITGGRQDYMNYFQQCREFTLEISDDKTPSSNQLPLFWDYNYRSLLNFMEQCTFGVRGTVKDASSGWPVVAEVNVLMHEQDSSWVYSSLPSGNYHRLLAEGTYSIVYSAPGYETQVISNVAVTNRQATIINVQLNPNTGVGGLGNSPVNTYVDIYPNPLFGNILTVTSTFKMDKIAVYDITGRLMLQSNLGNTEMAHLDLGALPTGIYYLKFLSEKGEGIKKILIQR